MYSISVLYQQNTKYLLQIYYKFFLEFSILLWLTRGYAPRASGNGSYSMWWSQMNNFVPAMSHTWHLLLPLSCSLSSCAHRRYGQVDSYIHIFSSLPQLLHTLSLDIAMLGRLKRSGGAKYFNLGVANYPSNIHILFNFYHLKISIHSFIFDLFIVKWILNKTFNEITRK